MLLPMEEHVLHHAPPLGQGLPLLTVFYRIHGDAFEPLLNCQRFHLDDNRLLPSSKKMLLNDAALCGSSIEAFRFYGIIGKSNTHVVPRDKAKRRFAGRSDVPVDLLDEPEPDSLVSRPPLVRKILNRPD